MVKIKGYYVNMRLPDFDELPFVETTGNIPELAGIYFLLQSESNLRGHNIAYIGQASNIKKRVLTHLTDFKDIIGLNYLELPDHEVAERLVLEKAYIMAYEPPYNMEIKINYTRGKVYLPEVLEDKEEIDRFEPQFQYFECKQCRAIIKIDESKYKGKIVYPEYCEENLGGCGRKSKFNLISEKYILKKYGKLI